MKTAIISVSSSSFVKGTQVLFNSFLRQNPNFDGDFIVLDAGLSEQDIDSIQFSCPDVLIEPINKRLVSAVDDLVRRLPIYAERRARFYSIEALRFKEYDRLLYCDSDMIFLQSVEDIFHLIDDLLVCGDGASLKNLKRDRVTFEQCEDGDGFPNTFNAGFMMFGKQILGNEIYQQFIEFLNTDALDRVTTGHTDQVLFNHLFSGRQTLIDPIYNFLLDNGVHEGFSENNGLEDIKVAHFNGPAKPWDPAASRESALGNPLYRVVQKQWFECYVDSLKPKGQG